MAKKPRHVVCTSCHLGQEQTPKQTFLGFYRFDCEECQTRVEYPLPTSYVVIYAMAIASLIGLAFGLPVGCGVILGVAGIIALVYDVGVRRRVREAEARERSLGDVRAETFR
jgi:hypothetical protein